jgi:flagellar motor switch protein FliN
MNENQGISENDLGGMQNRNLAAFLGSILEIASAVFPGPQELDVKFSLALVGKMQKREFSSLVAELPVVATIALRKKIGEKAAILTDIATASMLANIISGEEPIPKKTLSGDDLVSLFGALNPIIYALTRACEQTLGSPFGTIENVDVSDPKNRQSLVTELSESLCRATASVKVGNEKDGRIALVLPLDLVESLAASGAYTKDVDLESFEQNDIRAQDFDVLFPQPEEAQQPVSPEPPPEPSAQNIDLILDIQLKLAARLGQVEMPVGEILKLVPGSVIDIDRFVDEPIELLVNDRLIARGEIVVVQENFGIRITEIVSQKDRIKSLR